MHLHINDINACDCEVIGNPVTPTIWLLVSVFSVFYTVY